MSDNVFEAKTKKNEYSDSFCAEKNIPTTTTQNLFCDIGRYLYDIPYTYK